jgi:acetylornithine deacetylase/succinyl-diaminopimelate desuccinylase family protein
MADPCIELLQRLVAIDSVNPSLVPGAPGEREIAAAIADHLSSLGLDVHVQQVLPDRPNVIAVLETGVEGPSLMFCGHTDTVGVEGMSAPFSPEIRDGRLYGRGAQDMKAGVAAMIDAARVVRERKPRCGRLVVAAVIDEEFASTGADSLVTEWRADAAVVTEPTDLQIGVGHKGFAWLEIETIGRAAHGSRPSEGRDAIVRMGRVLGGLERLDRELQARPPHRLMGPASLHASIVEGGRELSVYPDRCRLQMERRTVAGESGEIALQEIERLLSTLRDEDPEFEAHARLVFARPPYETPPGHDLVRRIQTLAAGCGVGSEATGMSFWTDAAVLGGAGVPSVLFGPGGAGLHSTEEYVRVDEVITCRNVLAQLALGWMSPA